MKNTLKILILILAVAALLPAQTALTSTTLTNAITVNQQTFAVASTTGMTAANPKTYLYLIDIGGNGKGELLTVNAVNSSTSVTVARGAANRAAHVAGSFIVIGGANNAQSFNTADPPPGSCTAANTLYTPWINTYTGAQWLCSTLTTTWVPSWNNPLGPIGFTATLASPAGLGTVSGPLFHVTGTNAITGWTLPVGFSGGGFCVVPDGVFTWTNATNIALAGTAVVSKTLCFTYDTVTSKWYPSYIA